MAVSKRLRYEILRRDDHQCRYCGGSAPDVVLTVDHVVPTTLGGSDAPENLVTACRDCNAGKSASSPDSELVADVDQRAAQWGRAMAVVVERRAAELAVDRDATAWFDATWEAWKRGDETMPRDPNWKNSVLRFLAAGLDREFLTDAVATAMGKERIPDPDRWRYFCGICWREIEHLQERAREHLAAVEAPADLDTEEDEMPLMEMFSTYLDSLMSELCPDERVQKIAEHALWEGMSEADQVYRGCSPYTQPPAPGERLQEAREFLTGWIAPDMNRIRLLLREAGGADGTE